ARGVGPVSEVRVTSADGAARALEAPAARPDLVLVGGPTQNRGPSAGLRALVDAPPAALREIRRVPEPAKEELDMSTATITWLFGAAVAAVGAGVPIRVRAGGGGARKGAARPGGAPGVSPDGRARPLAGRPPP